MEPGASKIRFPNPGFGNQRKWLLIYILLFLALMRLYLVLLMALIRNRDSYGFRRVLDSRRSLSSMAFPGRAWERGLLICFGLRAKARFNAFKAVCRLRAVARTLISDREGDGPLSSVGSVEVDGTLELVLDQRFD